MKETYFKGLKTQQIEAIDHLYDLLLQSKDFGQFLSLGLEWITGCLKRPGSAICILNHDFDLAPEWVKFNTPEIWNRQFYDTESVLTQSAQHVYSTETALGPIPKLQISGIFPLSSHGKTIGSFILAGEPLNQRGIDTAEILLYTFSRLLLSESYMTSLWKDEKENVVLKTVASSFDQITEDPNQALLNLVKGIRSYFNAEYVLFMQKDVETPELIIKRMLGSEDDWMYQISQHISSEFLNKVLSAHNSSEIHTISNDDEYLSELIDSRGILIRSMCYSPIISKGGAHLGTIILINPLNQIGAHRKEILLEYSRLVAVILENINAMQRMKINLARAESTKMEVINSRKILREMFDNIPISIYLIDTSYTITACNIARSSRLSVSPRDLVRKTCFEALYGRNSPCPACRVNETFSLAKNTTRSWREWTSSEIHIEWEITTNPIFDEMHNPVQAIIQEVDVTDKRTLEDNLIQSEKLAAVGQLAAGVAHEINNPLAAIIANAQIMLQEYPDDNPDKIDSLKLIESAGIRASHVVRNLLSISHKDNQEFESTDINNTIRNALLLIQHELLKHPITVKMELSEKVPPVMAQQDRIQGVWINLLLNAMDAINSTNREDGMLTIKSWFTGSEIQVMISDNGSGIEPERIKKIFEPFYTTKAVGHGTGLGLSVCMRTIKEHQGNISVESQPGQGTRFTVSIPYTVDDVPD